MHRTFRLLLSRWAMLGMTALLLASSAGAVEVSDRDARAIRTVIESQLKALAADDAAKAFSFATPMIRKQFGDAPTFMTMVQRGYPMVIRPAATAFFRPEAAEGSVLQGVQLRDAEGRDWRVTYQMQRQADKSWRINGVAVMADDGKSTT